MAESSKSMIFVLAFWLFGKPYVWNCFFVEFDGKMVWKNHCLEESLKLSWLVVWNIFYFPIYWEQSSQLTTIFQRGGPTTNQYQSEWSWWVIFSMVKVSSRFPVVYHRYEFSMLFSIYQTIAKLVYTSNDYALSMIETSILSWLYEFKDQLLTGAPPCS